MNDKDIKMRMSRVASIKKNKEFIPCDPALNLCRDCSKKIAEGTCPKLPTDIIKRKKEHA